MDAIFYDWKHGDSARLSVSDVTIEGHGKVVFVTATARDFEGDLKDTLVELDVNEARLMAKAILAITGED